MILCEVLHLSWKSNGVAKLAFSEAVEGAILTSVRRCYISIRDLGTALSIQGICSSQKERGRGDEMIPRLY